MATYAWTNIFLAYLKELSHSRPSSFFDCFPKLTANFGLVPPLVVALAVRMINRPLAGPTDGHLRDKPLTLLPGRAGGIRRLPQALRIIDNFMAVSFSFLMVACTCFLSLFLLRRWARIQPEGGEKKLRWRRGCDGPTLSSNVVGIFGRRS